MSGLGKPRFESRRFHESLIGGLNISFLTITHYYPLPKYAAISFLSAKHVKSSPEVINWPANSE
jgi:hypothetical protein